MYRGFIRAPFLVVVIGAVFLGSKEEVARATAYHKE